MKRFVIYAPEFTLSQRKIWEMAGFDILPETDTEKTLPGPEGGVDVVRLAVETLADTGLEKVLNALQPRLLLLLPAAGGVLPEKWREIYRMQALATQLNGWRTGTKLEAPLPDDLGALLQDGAEARLADRLYEYLLQDVFRETAEWCGHMSSVVRRM